jgi:hypothetical protein
MSGRILLWDANFRRPGNDESRRSGAVTLDLLRATALSGKRSIWRTSWVLDLEQCLDSVARPECRIEGVSFRPTGFTEFEDLLG